MNHTLIVRRRAELQAAHARDWYDEQLDGLGDRFIAELDVAIDKAQRNPLHYQKVQLEIRRVLLRRFPYAVFFVIRTSTVVVLAVLRQSANPELWPKSP